jgi:ABC-2 type transport system permease protein
MWAVMQRDLLRILRNPFSLLSAVVLPLVYLFILGNALQGPLRRLPLGVVVQDEGPQARALIGALQAIEKGPKTVRLVVVGDVESGLQQVHSGKLSGLLVIPPSFSRDIGQGLNAAAGLFLDNAEATASAALQVAVQGAMASVHMPLVRFEEELGAGEIRSEEIFPRVDYDASLVPGVVVLSLFMGSLLAGGFNLVMDRFLGVHESYLSTPLRKADIALGVLGSGTVVTCVSASIVLTVGLLYTHARVHGGPLGYLAVFGMMVLTGLGLLAMMMALMARANHPRTAGVLSGFLSVILFFSSGAVYPAASFPGWLRAVSDVNPETHAVATLKAILFRSDDLGAAGPHVLYLAAFAAVMLVLATLTLKRRL